MDERPRESKPTEDETEEGSDASKPTEDKDKAEKESEDSFPASDPPSW